MVCFFKVFLNEDIRKGKWIYEYLSLVNYKLLAWKFSHGTILKREQYFWLLSIIQTDKINAIQVINYLIPFTSKLQHFINMHKFNKRKIRNYLVWTTISILITNTKTAMILILIMTNCYILTSQLVFSFLFIGRKGWYR